MSRARIYVVEAWHELSSGVRSSLVPLMFAGLVGYVLITLVSAEYLREMGGADVPRNSPLIVFQMMSGQAFWLIFAWAWVFAQPVTRDRAVALHEIVLAAPLSLTGLLGARFVGAVALACVLGTSSVVGFLLVPVLAAIDVVHAEALGPTPWSALAWGWVLFVLPTALGLGSLYSIAALRTRSSAGPFAAAAVVILLWMASMVVLRGGDVHTDFATLIDVSGFGEAERQTKLWTPHEKATALLELSPMLLQNRLLWTVVPLALFALVLVRQRREPLVLERTLSKAPEEAAKVDAEEPTSVLPAPRALGTLVWGRALVPELGWYLRRIISGWPFVVTVMLWTVLNVAGPFVHMIGNADGPLEPRAKLLAPFLVDLCYVFSVFVIAGFTGVLVRRDQRQGFEEMLDATPAPLGVRVLARSLAALALTMILALLPTLSAWVVMALAPGVPFEPWDPLAFNALVAAPALLELCAATLFVHALVRNVGTAHALSMLVAFIAIVNHEIGIVAYPPAQFGIPFHGALSELAGWSVWLAPLFTLDMLKLGAFGLLVAGAWLVLPRGTDRGFGLRWRGVLARLRGGAPWLAAASVLLMSSAALTLHEQLVVRGGFETPFEARASDAAWEARFWSRASAFEVDGGEVQGRIDVPGQTAFVRWSLHGVRARDGRLYAGLPHGMSIDALSVDGQARPVFVAHDQVELDLGVCAAQGCEVELELRVSADGWPTDEGPPWLHPSGVWARAGDLLPRLGIDPERALRSPMVREELGLSRSRPEIPEARALVAAGAAVAPAGRWRWAFELPEHGEQTANEGSTTGPLDLALVWLPDAPGTTADGGVIAWHGPRRAESAHEVIEDLDAVSSCVEAWLGSVPAVSTLVQAPRELGEAGVHGSLVWLPEHGGWDAAPTGMGRYHRRAALARALAAAELVRRADLRAEPGSRWLFEGVAGAVGLECVRALDGADAWVRLLDRRSDRVAQAIGALDAPIEGLAADGAAPWIGAYAPLATLGWLESEGNERVRQALSVLTEQVRAGRPLTTALASTLGSELAQRLLGVPAASDVSVVAVGSSSALQGERFTWQRGGWQSATRSFDVVQRFDDATLPVQRTRVPSTLPASGHFTVLDAAPSFERSPLDNVWRATDEQAAPGAGVR